ncbi:MAG: FGGY-family carbohydrate kinase, partial [Spirochaetota bacterium]
MERYIVSVDLGTTNIKTGVYNSSMEELSLHSTGVNYVTDGKFVEFDPEGYWGLCKEGIKNAIIKSKIVPARVVAIALSGQAESLVLLDRKLNPLRKGISWMDSRSQEECKLLKEAFDINEGYRITGQPDIIPTWPLTKMLWIKRNEREIFSRAYKYLLIKDYITFKLTGKLIGEYTVYNFSYYFDITRKRYWDEILNWVGVNPDQLPELAEPGDNAGIIKGDIAKDLGLSGEVVVNTGTLDHFAGMIGTANIMEGKLSENTGTVLAILTKIKSPMINPFRIPCHYGPVKNSYVLLSVCESGGISLEWFKRNFYNDIAYDDINREVAKTLSSPSEVIFLPYLTGVNAPEYDLNARGAFYGLRLHHSRVHMARAVMEGIAYILKKNLETLEKLGIKVKNIISMGGGAKSDVWNQIKADVTGKPLMVPLYKEATALGAAMLAGSRCGLFSS